MWSYLRARHTRRAVALSTDIVTDPTIRQPGFNLPCQSWSLQNSFRTGQDPCRAIHDARSDILLHSKMNEIVETKRFRSY